MLRKTAGAELCATSSNNSPKPVDCVKAIDRTYKGDVDLSDRVVVGVPVQKGPMLWQVPYNVKDDAGNEAVTVWRDIVVQEVELSGVERLIRDEVKHEYEIKQQEAIDRAIRAEKVKWDREIVNNNRSRRSNSAKSCPACPPCDCPNTPASTKESCSAFCDKVSETCTISDGSVIYSILIWLENIVGPFALLAILIATMLVGVLIFSRFFLTAIFNPGNQQSQAYMGNTGITNDATILRSPQPVSNGHSAPPRQSMSLANNGNMFSPQPQFASPPHSMMATNGTPQRQSEPMYNDSLYLQSPIITPSRTGDGVRRRNL